MQQALETRYSCRKFTSEEPSKELIEAVLEAGRLAPTACNYQPQRIYVITGEENLSKLDECTRCRYNAQAAFIIGFDTDVAAVHAPDRFAGSVFSFGDQDATSVLVHMALKATDLGLATCWLGAIDDDKLHELFGIPQNVAIRAVLDLGTPDPEKGLPSRMHSDRNPLESTVTWL